MSNPSSEFRSLIERMTQAICRGDGAAAAACFVPDGIYHDGFYGEFRGRDAIRDMVEQHFHANARDFSWQLSDALSDGSLGYAHYDFSYVSKVPGQRRRTRIFRRHRAGAAAGRPDCAVMVKCSTAVPPWCK